MQSINTTIVAAHAFKLGKENGLYKRLLEHARTRTLATKKGEREPTSLPASLRNQVVAIERIIGSRKRPTARQTLHLTPPIEAKRNGAPKREKAQAANKKLAPHPPKPHRTCWFIIANP